MNIIHFFTADDLASRIEAYFKSAGISFKIKKKSKSKLEPPEPKLSSGPEAEPATITGLAFFLGFNSREDFEDYAQNGQFASQLKRARLRIEAIYEKKLQQQSPAGAMFALKSLGWDEKPDNKSGNAGDTKTLTVLVVETGFQPSDCEKNVVL